MLKEIIIAIQSYIEAHQFIRKHKLWKWVLITGIFYTILFSLGLYLVSSDQAVTWLSKRIGIETWLQKQHSEWLSFLFMMSGLILWLIVVLFYLSLFKFFFLLIASPLFAYISGKTIAILEGRDYSPRFSQLMKDAWRGSRVALRNTVWQTVYLVVIFFLSFIPLFGWITPLVAFFVECYYYGFSGMDYSCDRNNIPPAASVSFISRHKGLAIGNGLVFYLMHGLIFVGWVLAPGYASVAATLSLHRIKNT